MKLLRWRVISSSFTALWLIQGGSLLSVTKRGSSQKQEIEHFLVAGASLPESWWNLHPPNWKAAPLRLNCNQWLCCLDIEVNSVWVEELVDSSFLMLVWILALNKVLQVTALCEGNHLDGGRFPALPAHLFPAKLFVRSCLLQVASSIAHIWQN